MPFLLSKIGCIASAAKLVGYAATIEGLPGGPPLAHWGLGEVGGTEIRDRKETRHGTYSGTIGYGAAGLPQGSSNAAIDFGAVGHGTVAHDSGLLLSAFTLSFWFQQHGLPHVEIGSLMPILTKDTSANTAGDFSIFVDTEGDLIVRMQDGAANHTLGAPISLDTTYHLAVRVDNTGFDAYLNGEYLGKNTNVTSAWAGNTQDLRFAFAPFLAYQEGDCSLDEVALYSRVLTEAEVLILAQQAQPPTAVGDAASIPESATTTIDVTANDAFVGSKAGLTVQIMSQPGGGDSVAVNANKDIAYTAGAVGANTARSFSYRITDPLGVSNTAAVNLTVLNFDAPASDQANCYTENTVDTVVVTTMAALESAVNAAPPGAHHSDRAWDLHWRHSDLQSSGYC